MEAAVGVIHKLKTGYIIFFNLHKSFVPPVFKPSGESEGNKSINGIYFLFILESYIGSCLDVIPTITPIGII
jgi:outer membrane receptor for Fe3+-dicitrate